MQNKIRGFTLVEIMIVVAIIAIIAVIAIPNLVRARVQANESAAKSSLKLISNALESYYAINNEYPTQSSSLIGDSPPYLNIDYFSGTHNGYTYSSTLAQYSYSVTAIPISANAGTASFSINTQGLLITN